MSGGRVCYVYEKKKKNELIYFVDPSSVYNL